jgi:MIR domain
MTGLTYHIPVRLKHAKTQRYLTGSRQRYTHQGTSNQCSVAATTDASIDATRWLPKCANAPEDEGRPKGAVPVNTAFRLEHIATSKNLHSHKDRPSPTSRQQEITLFGEMGLGDENDDWLVEVSDLNSEHVRIRHCTTGAFLHSHDQAFPAHLGTGLQEVTGFPDVSDPNNDWLVEPASSDVREPAFAKITFNITGTAIEESVVGHTGFTPWKQRVEQLILAEQQAWEWVHELFRKTQGQPQTSPNLDGIEKTAKRCTQSIQDLLERLTECQKRFETDALEQAVKYLNELLVRTFSERTIFRHSRDPEVAPVLQMAADRPIEAAFYLGTLLKVSPRIHTPEAVHGAYYALTAAEGASAIRAEADRASVDEAISQIQASARSHADDLNRSRAEADRLVAKLTADTQKFASDRDKAMNDAKAKFENLTKAMEAKVALKASIEYLSDRKLACGQAAQSALRVFVWTAFVSLVLLAGVMRLQFGGLIESQSNIWQSRFGQFRNQCSCRLGPESPRIHPRSSERRHSPSRPISPNPLPGSA